MATFTRRYTDRETGAEVAAPDWTEDAHFEQIATGAICDEDGSLVAISQVGTSEYARCRNGHRWQYSFGSPGKWIQLA